MPDNPTFEIGLVLSGTVSAGPYTAGVIDYLIEALDAWYKEKTEQEPGSPKTVPSHDVKIRVIAGNSGGAMTTSIIPGALFGQFKHFTGEKKPNGDYVVPGDRENRLYYSWVNQIDITKLLGEEDKESKELASLLDCTEIDRITTKIIDVQPKTEPRHYLCDFVDIYLTFTNIEGVPYKIGFEGGEHTMINHADYQHFILSKADPRVDLGGNPNLLEDDPTWLDAKTVGTNSTRGWQEFRRAAVSSGSFPVVLKSQFFGERTKLSYDERRWNIPLPKAAHEGICYHLAKIAPSWPGEPATVAFSAVDGGMANNDPLEYGRLGLTREPDGHSPRKPKEAKKAVIMIAPLNQSNTPTTEVPKPKKRALMIDVIQSIIPVFLDQSRFKYGELKLALSQDVRSRFLIAPSDVSSTVPKIQYKTAIYGSMLSAFGGFLLEEYRQHDYLLGRRNCQWFLQQHFVLPLANPIMTAGYASVESPADFQNQHGEYQIIPRIKSIPAIPAPDRVTGVARKTRRKIEQPVKDRINFILNRLPESIKEAPAVLKILASIADNPVVQFFLVGALTKAVLEKVEKAVNESEKPL